MEDVIASVVSSGAVTTGFYSGTNNRYKTTAPRGRINIYNCFFDIALL